MSKRAIVIEQQLSGMVEVYRLHALSRRDGLSQAYIQQLITQASRLESVYKGEPKVPSAEEIYEAHKCTIDNTNETDAFMALAERLTQRAEISRHLDQYYLKLIQLTYQHFNNGINIGYSHTETTEDKEELTVDAFDENYGYIGLNIREEKVARPQDIIFLDSRLLTYEIPMPTLPAPLENKIDRKVSSVGL